MAYLTIPEVAGAWLGAGGPRSRMVEFVAISMAESSLDDTAVSPVGAEGLWQVMPFWFPELGLPPSEWSNPHINAIAARRISGGGSNCAAWDTCYRDIAASGRYNFLSFPESGSAAANNIPHIAAVLNVTPPVPPPTGPQPTGHYTNNIPRLTAAWQTLGHTMTTDSAAFAASMALLSKRAVALATQFTPSGPPPTGY